MLKQRRTRNRCATLLATAAALVVAAGTLAACSSSSDEDDTTTAPLTVQTSSGALRGKTVDGVREFLGVRYAQPPIGARRWTLPSPASKSTRTVSATKAGASCAQGGSAPGASATASTSEDCLFLNVTTPRTIGKAEKLPVMVWWHGGGYVSGDGASYDAHRLADQGHVMVVTVNYRLGVFGYLSLPGLAGSGDFGFADQILATKWAKQNAAAFGGDPGNLTVFGQSSGAMSACALLTSPAAEGLVDKVAMSSGGNCQLNWPAGGLLPGTPAQTPYVPVSVGEKLGVSQAKTLGCSGSATLTCLRGKSAKTVLKLSPLFSNVLAYNTDLLPTDPGLAVREGKALSVPTLSGGTQNEERAFVGGAQAANRTYTAAAYPKLVAAAYGKQAGAVLSRYPAKKYSSPAVAFATLITDASWACPTLAGGAALVKGGSRVYDYEFADPGAPSVNGKTASDVPQGAAHADDMPYLFDLGGKSLLKTASQRELARTMIGYWSSFARTGTPKASGAPSWPQAKDADGPVLPLAPTVRTADVAAEHQCDFWSSIR